MPSVCKAGGVVGEDRDWCGRGTSGLPDAAMINLDSIPFLRFSDADRT
jgi:hypothetical protein